MITRNKILLLLIAAFLFAAPSCEIKTKHKVIAASKYSSTQIETHEETKQPTITDAVFIGMLMANFTATMCMIDGTVNKECMAYVANGFNDQDNIDLSLVEKLSDKFKEQK